MLQGTPKPGAARLSHRYACAMNTLPLLAFIIEFPTFAVLAWLYLHGRPKGPAWAVLLLALAAALAATLWGFNTADRSTGLMWPQVLAALAGYGAFLLVLLAGLAVRRR